ncbi:MAG: hypothetical protein OXC91_02345 [Rhodobacteraceae bacterium]|nr:hypothetical protein [Paracoccaceae bacterium]
MIKYTNYLSPFHHEFNNLAPGTVLSAIDLGMEVIIDCHPDFHIPSHIRSLRGLTIRPRKIEDYSSVTTNFTIPRFLELPALLREHGDVLLTDFDTVLRCVPPKENRLVFWNNSNFDEDPRCNLSTWEGEGHRIMANHVSMVGKVGLAFAEAVVETIHEMPRRDRDRWYSDQVALWRAWANKGPWPDIHHQPNAYFGLEFKDRPGVPLTHPRTHQEKHGGPWVEYTREYQDRWHR